MKVKKMCFHILLARKIIDDASATTAASQSTGASHPRPPSVPSTPTPLGSSQRLSQYVTASKAAEAVMRE
jgi:hypothetical protein